MKYLSFTLLLLFLLASLSYARIQKDIKIEPTRQLHISSLEAYRNKFNEQATKRFNEKKHEMQKPPPAPTPLPPIISSLEKQGKDGFYKAARLLMLEYYCYRSNPIASSDAIDSILNTLCRDRHSYHFQKSANSANLLSFEKIPEEKLNASFSLMVKGLFNEYPSLCHWMHLSESGDLRIIYNERSLQKLQEAFGPSM